MKKWHIGWKVVRVVKGRLFSAFCGMGEVEYKIGELTVPRTGCGPLAVFDCFDAAHSFVRMLTESHVKCQIVPCKYRLSRFRRMWDRDICQTLKVLPLGTRLADKVMLVKEK